MSKRKDGTGSLRKRGHSRFWHIGIPLGDGRLKWESSGTSERREAERILRERIAQVKAGTYRPGAPTSETIATYAAVFIERQRARGVKTARDQEARLRNHVLPVLGDKRLAQVTAMDLDDFHSALRTRGVAQNTRRHIWGDLRTLFRDAEQENRISASPFHRVDKAQRPKKAKRSAVQRSYFDVGEVETLITDSRIPLNRRIYYALAFFTGMRAGEIAGLRFSDLTELGGHGRIHLARQWDATNGRFDTLKGKPDAPGAPRDIPVHPELAAMLEDWRRHGYALPRKEGGYGRHPRPDDLITPNRNGEPRSHSTLKTMKADCARVGVAPVGRSAAQVTRHETRNTFATTAQAHGAPEVWVRRVTHNASGDTLAGYTADHWPAMCAAVDVLPFRRVRLAEVISIAAAASCGSRPGSDPPNGQTPLQSKGVRGDPNGTRKRTASDASDASPSISKPPDAATVHDGDGDEDPETARSLPSPHVVAPAKSDAAGDGRSERTSIRIAVGRAIDLLATDRNDDALTVLHALYKALGREE